MLWLAIARRDLPGALLMINATADMQCFMVFRQLVKEAESTPRLKSEGLDGPEIKQIASLVSAGTESPTIYYK